MEHPPDHDPLNEAPMLRSTNRRDPFVVPEGFFDRFPHEVQARLHPRARPLVRTVFHGWLRPVGVVVLVVVVATGIFRLLDPLHRSNLELSSSSTTSVEWAWEDADLHTVASMTAEFPDQGSGYTFVQHDLTTDELAGYFALHHLNELELIAELQ